MQRLAASMIATVWLTGIATGPASGQSGLKTFAAPRDLHGCLDIDVMKQWDSLADDRQSYAAFWLSRVSADQCATIPEGTSLSTIDAALFDYEKVRVAGHDLELWVHSKGLP